MMYTRGIIGVARSADKKYPAGSRRRDYRFSVRTADVSGRVFVATTRVKEKRRRRSRPGGPVTLKSDRFAEAVPKPLARFTFI